MPTADEIRDGAYCRVVAGTHKGKSGAIEDRKTSRTGAVTITVRLDDDDRIKTLAKNVVAVSR